jgi:hypothetical protein
LWSVERPSAHNEGQHNMKLHTGLKLMHFL